MVASTLLWIAAAVPALDRFASEFPASRRIAASGGRQLVHASGFLAAPGAGDPADAARAFLAAHGAAFGVTPRQALIATAGPGAGEIGAVRFERVIDGLPVFGGDLVVGVDERGRPFVVNGAAVPADVSGRHSLGASAAERAAIASFAGAGPAAVAAGWRALAATTRAVYRVDFIAADPPGDWRVFVDGETGTTLFRQPLRFDATAPGSAFEVSPVETAANLCPMSGTARSFCAAPVPVTMQNLNVNTELRGSQTSVYDCMGANYPTTAAGIPGPCMSVFNGAGAFNLAPDSTYRSLTDDFAGVMAYYHLDRHVSFFKALDPTLPPASSSSSGSSRALRGSLPALVNVRQGGARFDNAFFSGTLDAMVFGQGASTDYAYDATVMYHELTHGVVHAWGGFDINIDAAGGLDEPGAVNEGTADSLAVAQTGRSAIGAFVGATTSPPRAHLRDLDDAAASRTCQGDGTNVRQFGITVVNGMNGEVHDDGEIWNGFFWEVYDGLRRTGARACGGACDAGPALQYKALQLAGGTSPTLDSYWQTFKAAASAMFASQPGVAAYVDCVARRRKLDKCDRTFPLYAGEHKAQFIRLRYSPFQIVIKATGAAQFTTCSALGTATTVHARKDQPVQLSSIDPDNGNATVTADASTAFTKACSQGSVVISLASAGDWHLLFDSPAALAGGNPGLDVYRIDGLFVGMATRPASTAPGTCVPPPAPLFISPVSPVPPRGKQTLTAGGGSLSGYSWSMPGGFSGGSIEAATGIYTAGPNPNTTDLVRVTDSKGEQASRTIAVSAGVSIAPAPNTSPPRGKVTFVAQGGSGTGFAWTLDPNGSGGSISAAGVYTAGPNGGTTDVVKVVDSLGNGAQRSVSIGEGVVITPPAAGIRPRAAQAFRASGGSGTGFTWSLSANGSGGAIEATTGIYKAGEKGSVTDEITVTDSLGNTKTAKVSVFPNPGCLGCASGGFEAAAALALLVFWRRRRRAAKARC